MSRTSSPSFKMKKTKYTLRSCVRFVDYSTKEDAESAKEFIDKHGCCGVCGKNHTIKEYPSK
jgi:hypothetical protein